MKQEIIAVWKEDLSFEIKQPGGMLTVDASESVGGNDNGLRPKALMLSALAGCTGMDVASLLKKMKVDKSVSEFTIHVEAELTDEHPKVYTDTKIVYTFIGLDLNQAKIEKAINLSKDKYCGVYEMFKGFSAIETKIVYKES